MPPTQYRMQEKTPSHTYNKMNRIFPTQHEFYVLFSFPRAFTAQIYENRWSKEAIKNYSQG